MRCFSAYHPARSNANHRARVGHPPRRRQNLDEIAANAGVALKAAAGLFTNLDNSYSKQGGLKDQLSVGLDKAAVALADFDKLVKGL